MQTSPRKVRPLNSGLTSGQQTPNTSTNGLTILEVLVAIAVLGILAALLLPAVSMAREAARRSQCAARLRQLSLAMTNYEENFQVFPNAAYKYHLLPYLDLKGIYDKRLPNSPDDRPYSVYQPILQEQIAVLICPSESYPIRGPWCTGANYVGCFGSGVLAEGFNGILNNGPYSEPPPGLTRAKPVRSGDVTDGLSNTSMFSEMLIGPLQEGDDDAVLRRNFQSPDEYLNQDDLVAFCDSIPDKPSQYGYMSSNWRGWPWCETGYMIGMYNHALTPNRPSCKNGTHLPTGVTSATSQHDGGVQVVFGDGHVEFVSNVVDEAVWRDMGSRFKLRK